jgi:cobalt/nickel transport system permease protein
VEEQAMSHIHISDGIIPPVWWIPGYVICLAIVFSILRKTDLERIRQRVPTVAMMAAVMLVTMSVPLGFLPFHMNFAALAGMMLGPALSFVSVFVVNLILALLGHGGITAVGINTLTIGIEAALGGALFKYLKSKFGGTASAAISTLSALLLSTVLIILFLSSIGVVDIWSGEGLLHTHEEHEDHGSGDVVYRLGFVILTGWGAVLAVILAGILLETVISVLIIRFFMKVRSDIVQPVSEENRQ